MFQKQDCFAHLERPGPPHLTKKLMKKTTLTTHRVRTNGER
jgi:hypothetical protein